MTSRIAAPLARSRAPWHSAWASSTRRRSPPDRVSNRRSASGAASTRASAASAAATSTAALDPAHAIAVMGALAVERASGAAILLVTHDLDLAARHADRVLVLVDGGAIALGAPLDVFGRPEVAAGFGARLHVGELSDGGRFVVAR